MKDITTWLPRVREHSNGTTISFRGIEAEIIYQLQSNIELYGNYSFSQSKYDSRYILAPDGSLGSDLLTENTILDEENRVTGVPAHLWNIGIEWRLNPDLILDLHFRGWADNVGKFSGRQTASESPEAVTHFKTYGPAHFLNLNLLWSEALRKEGLDLSFYIKNILDSNTKTPSAIQGGYIEEPNRRLIGFTMGYRY